MVSVQVVSTTTPTEGTIKRGDVEEEKRRQRKPAPPEGRLRFWIGAAIFGGSVAYMVSLLLR